MGTGHLNLEKKGEDENGPLGAKPGGQHKTQRA